LQILKSIIKAKLSTAKIPISEHLSSTNKNENLSVYRALKNRSQEWHVHHH